MYKAIIRPLLFLFDPELIHHFIFKMIKFFNYLPMLRFFCRSIYTFKDERLKRTVFGLEFDNPIGLAAGFDKDAILYNELANFGFGFIEIGTLTPLGQIGNPKPRLFRLPEDEGLINRMGFNNNGVNAAVQRLQNRNTKIIIGGNIGKNKDTPNNIANLDYVETLNTLYPYVDYFVVNVSSPNTPNLRDLQDKKPLTALMQMLKDEMNKKEKYKPILLKISPDLSFSQLDDIISIIENIKIDGVIATNTTINRSKLKIKKSTLDYIGSGGVSGKPLKNHSIKVIKYLYQKSNGSFPIIGVGGIHNANDVIAAMNAGASLVQVYSGFIYEGPSMVKKICKVLLKQSHE